MIFASILFGAATVASQHVAKAIDPASWFSPENYPIEAMKNGIEGSVSFEVDVDESGKPTDCQVTKSSGSAILDTTTCEVVKAKAQFAPAVGADSKPTRGHYRNIAVWRLPGPPTKSIHTAVIIDFTSDPDHPSCRTVASSPDVTGPSCEQVLKNPSFESVKVRLAKLVFLIASAPGNEAPYRGELDWGTRLSLVASDQYYLKGPKPFACVSVAAEGTAQGADACAGFPGARSVDERTQKGARKIRTEFSVFAVPREVPTEGLCRGGESAAEAKTCN